MDKMREAVDELKKAGLILGADQEAYALGNIDKPIVDRAEVKYCDAEAAVLALYEADEALIKELAEALTECSPCVMCDASGCPGCNASTMRNAVLAKVAERGG